MSENCDPQSLVNRIKNKLVFLWREALKPRMKLDELSQRRNVITPKGGFSIGKEGISCLESIIHILKKEIDQYDDKFSDYYVKYLIENSIINLLNQKEKEIMSYAEKEAIELISKLKSPLIDMNFIMPITNLKMIVDSLQIGHVTFRMFKEPNINDESGKKCSKFVKEKVLPKFRNQIVAEVNVKSIDVTKANLMGKQHVYEALDVIRFFAIIGVVPQSYWSKNYFDVQGKLHKGILMTLLDIPTGNEILNAEASTTGYLLPFEITLEFVEHMNKCGIYIINELLCMNVINRNDFENRIISAIRFAGSSYMYAEEAESFLKCMISLESLLLSDKESKSENLAERVALIIANNLKDRSDVYDIMRKLYNIRNKIVHEGFVDVDRSDVVQLQYYTFLCIMNILNRYKQEKITNINEFIKWIRDMKFS